MTEKCPRGAMKEWDQKLDGLKDLPPDLADSEDLTELHPSEHRVSGNYRQPYGAGLIAGAEHGLGGCHVVL